MHAAIALDLHRTTGTRPRATRPRKPMPATTKDLDSLRALVSWAQTGKADAATKAELLRGGLERAIGLLERRESNESILWWTLGALRDSVKRNWRGDWVVADRGLMSWALDQIEQRVGG